MAGKSSWLSIPGLLGAIRPTGQGGGMQGSFSAQNVPLAPGFTGSYDLSKFSAGGPEQIGSQSRAAVKFEPMGLSAGRETMSFEDISQFAPFLEVTAGNDKLRANLKRRFGKAEMLPSQWEAALQLPSGSISGYMMDRPKSYGLNAEMNIPLSYGLLAERSLVGEQKDALGNLGLSASYNATPYAKPDINLLLNYAKRF